MLVIRESQLQQIANALQNTQVVKPCAETSAWIEFRLVDQNGRPIAGEPYCVRLPDQSFMTGQLDGEGRVRFEGIVPGQASICFTAMDEREWHPL